MVTLALEAARRREARARYTELQNMALSNGIETGKQHHNIPKSEPGGYYATPDLFNAELERLQSVFAPEEYAALQATRKAAARAEKKARMAEKIQRIQGGADAQHGHDADPGSAARPGTAGPQTAENRG